MAAPAPAVSEGGRTGTYKTSFEGIIPMLMRRFKETTSESMRKHYLRYFSDKPCSACKGERLRPESRAVSIGDVGETAGKSIVQVSRMTIGLEPCLDRRQHRFGDAVAVARAAHG